MEIICRPTPILSLEPSYDAFVDRIIVGEKDEKGIAWCPQLQPSEAGRGKGLEVMCSQGVGGRVSEGWTDRQSGGRKEERSELCSAAALGILLAN